MEPLNNSGSVSSNFYWLDSVNEKMERVRVQRDLNHSRFDSTNSSGLTNENARAGPESFNGSVVMVTTTDSTCTLDHSVSISSQGLGARAYVVKDELTSLLNLLEIA
uniref:Uncharacterized protein n=1 Tax=Rhodnius prolixus TaxID=13249 RepID=T1HXF0_RHOPR